MDQQQIIAYIAQHLQQGHAESAIREHLARTGWPQELINQSFAAYYATYGAPSMHSPTASPLQYSAQPAITPGVVASRPVRKKSRRKWLVAIPALSVVVVIIAVIYMANSPKTLDKLAQPAVEQNAQNAARQNDAAALMSAIAEYLNAHNGNVPQSAARNDDTSLKLCGIDCDATASKATLNHYQPSAVSFKAFTTSLKIPDAETVYVVPGAKCNQNGDGLAQDQSGRAAIVVLYGLTKSSSLEQKCLAL